MNDEANFETQATQAAVRDYRNAAASAVLVNRTHRVVRERARNTRERRKIVRGLYLPLGVSAALLASVVFAVWSVLDEYELTPTGVPDAGQQIFVLLMWCLPISLAVLAVVLFGRSGGAVVGSRSDEGAR